MTHTDSIALATLGYHAEGSSAIYNCPINGIITLGDFITEEIKIYRGDSINITVTIKDHDGTIFDLTGYAGKLTVKSNSNDVDLKAKIGPITGVADAPTTGVIVFNLTSANTSISPDDYVYDVQLSGGIASVITVAKNIFTIIDDVTKG